jgi:hypothetical protein
VQPLGRMLMALGGAVFLLGLLLTLAPKLPLLGKLPGDIVYQRGNFTFYFPIVTCLVVSLLLTLVFSLLRR